jgi:Uma2 family endonuclease
MTRPMPRVPPLDRPATYEDLVALPDLYVAEIVGGELYASRPLAPLPNVARTALLAMVGRAYSFGQDGPGGWWILILPELHFGSDVVVPDLAGWRRSRMARLPNVDYFSVVPDWVCEVLSPPTVALDRAKKLPVYAREGVEHAWMLDADAQTLERLRLEDGHWSLHGVHGGNEVVRTEPFGEIDLELRLLCQAPPSPA